ncbi:MAG: hypothetical protein RL091_3716 [Verrucomicrobiota bacterium]
MTHGGLVPRARFPLFNRRLPPMKSMTSSIRCLPALLALFLATVGPLAAVEPETGLVGAWRGGVQFKTGSFAAVKDLEFMYAFNAGGTMTESSNYDSVPPVAPAYGIWRQTGPGRFQAKYTFYWTKPPGSFEEIAKGGGWNPGGHGVLVQDITLARDGRTFKSVLTLEMFNQAGALVEPKAEATARGTRLEF